VTDPRPATALPATDHPDDDVVVAYPPEPAISHHSTGASGGSAFVARHIGPRPDDLRRMLDTVGYRSLDALVAAAVPADIRDDELPLPPAEDEAQVSAALADLAARNATPVSMIGMGYSDTLTPPVIRRSVLEDPGWYTAYTPYQAEISQGRLEALLTFQTVVEDLTGLPVAGASLLDEATAAAEAMALCRRAGSPSGAFVVDTDTHPQTIAVLRTRAEPMGIELLVADLGEGLPAGLPDQVAGILYSYPGSSGAVRDPAPVVRAAHERGALVVLATDLLALALLTPPGELGADIAVGSAQRFGVPMFYGGPHAGFLAVRAGLERNLPGRLVGVSVDADGAPAYRLALQTREQHIRREKATSNICTAQVLLAVVAAMYAVYHGPDGLTAIARRVAGHAARLAHLLAAAGFGVPAAGLFDTVTVTVPGRADAVLAEAAGRGINLRRVDADTVAVSCDEVTTAEHVGLVVEAIRAGAGREPGAPEVDGPPADLLPAGLRRRSTFLTHPVFHEHRSETEMLRYLRRLRDADVALDRSMIPLGSCTMKLNAAVEMEPISWPGFARVHPFAPRDQVAGYRRLIAELERDLAAITGYDAVSLQPNAGSQGELAGLLAIRGYHQSRGEPHRTVCLIPSSAHGTNAASAAMAGLRVVVVACDRDGNVDLADLSSKLAEHGPSVAAIMLTYPSTHGVFEATIRRICDEVHAAGGQVYVDGANLNALVGLARPGRFGADVSHLNLHKTFCIPHGGGGPGVGPVAARAHLAPFLPGHPLNEGPGSNGAGRAGDGATPAGGPVSAAPFGSAGILPIPWAYVRLMGAAGLRRATEVAILSANYLARRLLDSYPVLYTGPHGLVAHECIVDLRAITRSTGITVEDVAKRLIDYGFHAPTISFPVSGTMMIEPTESESLAELDRFCDAMTAIRREIDRVAAGEWPREDNPLRGAPHTAAALAGDWAHPYSRREAVFPDGVDPARKYWPPVRRIDASYGDRNLMCACPPAEAFAE
jgi:glycine dehydrogenase